MLNLNLTLTNPHAARVLVALGKAHKLVDSQTPPVARDATQTELKQYLVEHLKRLVGDIEGQELQAASQAILTPPILDVT